MDQARFSLRVELGTGSRGLLALGNTLLYLTDLTVGQVSMYAQGCQS